MPDYTDVRAGAPGVTRHRGRPPRLAVVPGRPSRAAPGSMNLGPAVYGPHTQHPFEAAGGEHLTSAAPWTGEAAGA